MSIASLADARREFAVLLPMLESTTRYAFRKRKLRRHDFEDILAETVAACWSAWVGMIARGRDPLEVGPCGIANQAVRYVRNGRRVGRGRNSGGRHKLSVDNGCAIKRGGYKVVSYDCGRSEPTEDGVAVWKEWVAVDRQMGPADAAAFRLDFESWLARLPERRRQTALLLAQGRGTAEVAGLVGVTPAAVSQARSYLERRWREFIQEPAAAAN